MANTAITGFTADTTPVGADLITTVKSPFGAGSNRKVTWTNVFANSQAITFPAASATAITAASYQIGRDADGVNQMHFNVPTGAGYEFSVNDTYVMLLSAANGATFEIPANISGSFYVAEGSNEYIVVNTGAGTEEMIFGDTHNPNYSFLGSGDFNLNNHIAWDTGRAGVATDYSVGRSDDTPNELILNVPTGAGITATINGVAIAGFDTAFHLLLPIQWESGTAVTATNFQITQNVDATNNLQYNVPTSSIHQFSINGVVQAAVGLGTVAFPTGGAVDATSYSAGRDADGTNQLHFNVPTGATMEWSVNDVAQMTLSASTLGLPASGSILSFNGGDVTLTHSSNNLAFAGGNYSFTQPAITGGSPTGFSFVSGAHENLANASLTDIDFDLSSTRNFTGGEATIELVTGMEIFYAGSFTADAAQTIDAAIGFVIRGGMPSSGANITQNAQALVFFGEGGWNGYGTDINLTMAFNMPNLAGSIGSTTDHLGIGLYGENVVLGNQTATTTNVALAYFGAYTYTSTTNVRTVTNPSTVYIEGAPIASTNVTFTNGPYALFVDAGTSRFDGIIQSGTSINSLDATSSTLTLQNQTFTAGAFHAAVTISPTWTQESFNHVGLWVDVTQNGANASALYGILVNRDKVTGATNLNSSTGIYVDLMTMTGGTITENDGIVVANQGHADITTSHAIHINAQSGAATSSDGIYIASATRYSIFADAGVARFDDGLSTKLSNANVSSPPTDAELDSAFGDPSTLPVGFMGIVDDAGAGTDAWWVYTTGVAGEWFYIPGTKAI